MASLLSFGRIRHKVAAIGAIGVLGLAAVAAIYFTGNAAQRAYRDTAQAARAISRLSGESVVALLDQTQAAALASLPFASQLKTLVQSGPLPVALITVVDSRVPAPRAKAFQSALVKMNAAADGADMLASLRLKGFVLPNLPGNAPKP